MRSFCIILLLLLGCTISFGQPLAQRQRFTPHAHQHSTSRTTVADLAEDKYDVAYVKLDVAVSNMSTAISGNALTRATVVAPSPMTAYVFELTPLLTIDSVFINGVQRPVTSSGLVRTVSLAAPLTTGATFIAQVYYHGTPVSGSLFNIKGMNNLFDSTWYANVTFTLSEPYEASEWWPCKQALKDKIDSADIWITVPDSVMAGSNGLLQQVTTIDATHKRYEWKERTPINYYLISLAVGPYVDYSYYMHFTGSTDSMLMQHYVYNSPAALPYFKPALDSTDMMINYFSTLFGRYPFWKEKYGHSMASLYGAEEHQTMTTIGSQACDVYTIAHELAHQWFGNNVTCATWGDIMINEGFASYGTYLFQDHFHSHMEAITDLYYTQQYVKSYDTGTVYVYDTTTEDRIFDGRLSYAKGECVLHMLRAVYNYDDSAFFRVFRTFQQQRQNGNGTVEDFKNTAKALSGTTLNGINLDTFFHQWVYREGFPIYSVRWNQVGNDVTVQIDQTTSAPSSVPYFTLPIDMTLRSGIGANFLYEWVINNAPAQTYHFTWPYSSPMTDLYLDPAAWLVFDLDTVIHDVTLGIADRQAPVLTIGPNPATTSWSVSGIPAGSLLSLTDLYGRTLWQLTSSNPALSISADQLSAGLYMLRLTTQDGKTSAYKLIKQ